MGFGLRFREKVKQTGKKGNAQPDKHGFVPTTYERTALTYDEAVKFAESLKVLRKRISEATIARTKMLKDIEGTLTGSLPCIHEIDPVSGEHTTAEASPEGAANYVHTGTLTRLSEEGDAKLQTQVFQPIDKWISEVDLFKGKMKILENLRLELDGSRRDHINIENKIAKSEAKSGGEADPKHTTHIQSKDASVAGKRTAFEQYEASVYEELVAIIGETGVLHTALDRVLKLEIDTYQRALDPISSTTARLETLSSGSNYPVNVPAYGGSAPGSNYPGNVPASGGAAPDSNYPVPYTAPGGGTESGTGGLPHIKSAELPSVATHTGIPAHSTAPAGSAVGVSYEKPSAV